MKKGKKILVGIGAVVVLFLVISIIGGIILEKEGFVPSTAPTPIIQTYNGTYMTFQVPSNWTVSNTSNPMVVALTNPNNGGSNITVTYLANNNLAYIYKGQEYANMGYTLDPSSGQDNHILYFLYTMNRTAGKPDQMVYVFANNNDNKSFEISAINSSQDVSNVILNYLIPTMH